MTLRPTIEADENETRARRRVADIEGVEPDYRRSFLLNRKAWQGGASRRQRPNLAQLDTMSLDRRRIVR